jgi:hypothetical protein
MNPENLCKRGGIQMYFRHKVKDALPDLPSLNVLLAGRIFKRVHGRTPRAPIAVNATINDYIFDRMTRRDWSGFERRCVDKVEAKKIVRELCPELRSSQTVAIVDVERDTRIYDLIDALMPYIGQDAVAMPTHSSGAILSLLNPRSIAEFEALLTAARQNYFSRFRERQYAGLARRVIVEERFRFRSGRVADAYRFACVRGVPIFCQVDHSWDVGHVRRIYDVATCRPLISNDGIEMPARFGFATADQFAAMRRYAERLSTGHEFVRVDFLYSDLGVRFGQLAFTPGAGLGSAPGAGTHDLFSEVLMARLRAKDRLEPAAPDRPALLSLVECNSLIQVAPVEKCSRVRPTLTLVG